MVRERDQLETGTRTWLEKLNNMLTEPDWLNVLDRGEHKGYIIQADQVWFCSRIPGQLGTVFVDGDANMNNSRGRKGIYPSAGLRATHLSRGRKRKRFWRLRLAVDKIRHLQRCLRHANGFEHI